MVDITKDEFWEEDYQKKDTYIRETIRKNKFLSVSFLILGICVLANIILIYSFFKILTNL